MSALSSWTARVANQQAEQEASQRAEDDRLLAEIAAARRVRESRKAARYGRVSEQNRSSSGHGNDSPAPGSSSSSSATGSIASQRSSTKARFAANPSSFVPPTASSTGAPPPRKVTRVAPPPLSLFPSSHTGSTFAGKENPERPLRSASPTKSLISPTIQAAARFFEAPRSSSPPPSPAPESHAPREPLSPAKRSFNTPSLLPPATALPATTSRTTSEVPFTSTSISAARKRVSHRPTRSFAYAPSAPPASRGFGSTTPSPPSTLSKASPSRAQVQPLRSEPAASRPAPFSAATRDQSASASAARTELAALAPFEPSTSTSSSTARKIIAGLPPSSSSAVTGADSTRRAPLRHRATQSVSVPCVSSSRQAAIGGTPKSIKDIIASLPISSEPVDARWPTPIGTSVSHRRTSQSISYLPSPVGFARTPASSSTDSRNNSLGHTPSPSHAAPAAPAVSRPPIVAYSSTPSSRALAQERRPGSPSVREIIASFPSAAAAAPPSTASAGSSMKGMSSASSSLFRPKGHQRGSQSISYLPSTASRLAGKPTASSSIIAPTAAGSDDAASRLRTSSLNSTISSSSPAAECGPALAPSTSSPSPPPRPISSVSTSAPRTVPSRPPSMVASEGGPSRAVVPPSSSLTRLAGRGLVAQRVAHAPSELAKSEISEARERKQWSPPKVVQKDESPPRSTSPTKIVFQSPEASPSEIVSLDSSPASSTPSNAFGTTKSQVTALQETHTPRRYLRGPALPGLADPSSVSPTSHRPLRSQLSPVEDESASTSASRPASLVKGPFPGSSQSSLDKPSSALPETLKSPALLEGGHGLGFSGLTMRRDDGRDDKSKEAVPPVAVSPEKVPFPPASHFTTTVLPRAMSPRHVKLPSSPVKTSFEVAAHPDAPPISPSRAPTSPGTAGSPSSVKLTHPTRMRPKRPKALKKGRSSFPPALVSPVRLPAPPIAVPVMSQARRRAFGVVVPVEADDKEEEMQQVVRTPPNSWSRQDGRKASTQLETEKKVPVQSSNTDSAQDAKFQLFVASLLADAQPFGAFKPSPTTNPISTDVFQIASSGISSPLPLLSTNAPPIFYETELLVFVHRAKDLQTKLVESRVWAWKGKRWEGSDEADAKVDELGRRYGATVVLCAQGEEPAELMHILGERLVTRQGWRAYYDDSDSAIYAVKQTLGSLFVDQVDMLPSALTSRHPLVLTIIGQTFLYVPRGSLAPEIGVARLYAALLSPDNDFTEFSESSPAARDPALTGLFWMCLGQEKERELGALADHWKFRPTLSGADDLQIWIIDCSNSHSPAVPLDPRLIKGALSTSVAIVLSSFEAYVVVGSAARGRQADITFALQTAAAMATRLAPSRPFVPPVHALVMPSQCPTDLATYFRFLDDDVMNGGSAPRHMNLLSFDVAMSDLQNLSWDASRLADSSFLPLGVAPNSS